MAKKKKVVKQKEIFIIQYNDCYGNGDNKSFEGALEKRSDFKLWLEEHNKVRTDEGEMEEEKEEFNLIRLSLYKPE